MQKPQMLVLGAGQAACNVQGTKGMLRAIDWNQNTIGHDDTSEIDLMLVG
jgi:hypothetical protein